MEGRLPQQRAGDLAVALQHAAAALKKTEAAEKAEKLRSG
jgi:hypothetical protein